MKWQTAPLCDDCAQAHRLTPATRKLTWDLGHKWLCDRCAQEYPGWIREESQ